ncbi:Prostatic acid phosphatase [Habropoda laboriosa]|uniref:acid phosphatase n=1 Tax=Habropoda laboriosa TaxID=597456 RepID=A0A0L7RF19_9HYME|nr:Prostatic acid phosphatase [Habropoda laboriosa]
MGNMSINLVVIILVFCIINLSYAQDTDLGVIVFANVLYRHGDRTPTRFYANDPYDNENLWPVPYGQLTNNLYNKTLPKWTKSVFPEKLKPIAAKSFTINAHNKILQRLKSGSLLGEMIDHMEKKSKNALMPNRKIWMYSAHDDTLANMLMTLNVFEPHCPPYIAVILIELRVNLKNQYFVTVSYKNTSDEPQLLTLPGCIALCPLNQFITLTKDVIPVNWEKECAVDWEQFGYNMNTTAVIAILTSSILMLVLLVLSIIGFIYWHYKREHNQYYLRLTTDPI